MRSLFFLLLSGVVAAQTPAPPRVGVGVIERKLSLDQAIELALKNNLEIEIERSNTAVARQAIKAAKGIFDPSFRYQPGIEARNTPAASLLQGAGGNLAEHYFAQNFYLRQRTPWWGSSFNVDFENTRSSSSNAFASLNPLQTSRLTFGFILPLLRNRDTDAARAEIRIRGKQSDVAEKDLELRVIDVVLRAESAYWDLVAAIQNVQVTADGVEWAREQLARNQRMISAGSLAPVELAASEAELQRRIDTWYSAIGAVTEVENGLKLLLAPDRHDPIWGDALSPADQSMKASRDTDDVRAAVADALKARPELRQIELRKETNDVQKQLASDQTKPQVNLTAAFVNQGLGGSVRPGDNPFSASQAAMVDRLNRLSELAGMAPLPSASFGSLPENLVGGYGAALSNLFGGNYPSVQAGISFDLNLRNRTAQANYAQTVIGEKRLKLEQARIEQAIEAQVRNALQAIETAKQRIAAAAAGERAAKEKLDSEVRLFQTGESTNFLVLTRQNEFLDSRRRSLVAHLDFNKAVSRLEQALGNTLKAHNITVQ